jgi:hypothetical protein
MVSPLVHDFMTTDRQDQLANFAKKYQMALEIRPDTQLSFNDYKILMVI